VKEVKGNAMRAALIFFIASSLVMSVPALCAAAAINAGKRIEAAADVLEGLARDRDTRGLSAALRNAKGIAIFPNARADAIGLDGEGFALAKEDGEWKGPSFASFSGGTLEFQAGVNDATLVVIINSDEGLAEFKNEKGFGFSGEFRAAPGAMGTASVPEGHFQCYIVSSQFFDGIALSGAILSVDGAANRVFWKKRITAIEALETPDDMRAERLTSALTALMNKPGN
jgi:lipid-binding SYLF domain-containing protein